MSKTAMSDERPGKRPAERGSLRASPSDHSGHVDEGAAERIARWIEGVDVRMDTI